MPKSQVKTTEAQDHDLTDEEVEEFIKCANDCLYFIQNYVKIQHPTLGSVLFNLRDYQKRVFDGLLNQVQNIILQPRQSGKSIAIVGYLLWETIFHPDVKVGVAAHKGSGAKEIIKRFKYAYENLPDFLKPIVTSYNVHDVAFDNNSSILSSTTTESTFRGESLSIIYLDEFAFVKPKITKEFWASLLPSMSAGGKNAVKLIITSTPNGTENKFAELWFTAEHGNSSFNPIRVSNSEVPDRDEEFKNQMLETMTLDQYNQEFECVSGDTILFVDGNEITMESLYDSL